MLLYGMLSVGLNSCAPLVSTWFVSLGAQNHRRAMGPFSITSLLIAKEHSCIFISPDALFCSRVEGKVEQETEKAVKRIVESHLFQGTFTFFFCYRREGAGS